MTLADLKTGATGVIIKVKGHGTFRRRILEMGFIQGQKIDVIKNAPLKDPIEYSILGYHVSLRRTEASMIDVDPSGDQEWMITEKLKTKNHSSQKKGSVNKGKTIRVAFLGNPNAGKTSLFNFASKSHEHTANYSGVTIDSKTARVVQNGYTIDITDLPGTYSISAYTPEELYVRNYIIDHVPDVLVNVVDASNLERNLFLTTQLMEMGVKMVIALNMYDELQKRQDEMNYILLSELFGTPVVPTVGTSGRGIKELMDTIINVFHDKEPLLRHIDIQYGGEIETSLRRIEELLNIAANTPVTSIASSRFIAINLLKNDQHIEEYFRKIQNPEEIISLAAKERNRIQLLYGEDATSVIISSKYGFIRGAIKETFKKGARELIETDKILDSILTHKIFGFPFFLFFMWFMFYATFKLGEYPKHWIESGVSRLGMWLDKVMDGGSLKDLLIDGIIGGVGGVIVFLPNILILFLFISFMEDSGYMSRAVFIMDKLMHRIGLHGKSFISLIMGFGCNAPAIMATRIIEDRNSRLLTMLINPFMSCSARLPVYLLLIGAIFPGHQGSLLFLLYMIGILLAIGVALLFKNTLFKSEQMPFVMELPPYRMPTARSTLKHMWFKGSQYLQKIGGVILVASIILWALGYFPREAESLDAKQKITGTESVNLSESLQIDANPLKDPNAGNTHNESSHIKQLENSYIGRLGKWIEPVLRPLGFNWKMGIALLTGITAKEVVVSTLGVLHHSESNTYFSHEGLTQKLQKEVYTKGVNRNKPVYTPLVTISFLLFVLIYFPCIAVFAAVKKESGSIKWAFFMVFYTTILAYAISFIVYQTGNLIFG